MNILFIVKHGDIEHLGIMLLSRILKDAGHTVEIVESIFDKVAARLSHKPFSIIAFSVPTIYAQDYLILNKKIKAQFKVFSIWGGPHPTYVPEVIYEDGVDCVCIGEGEHAFLELANAMESGKPISGISNLWVKDNGIVFKNPLRPLIDNLDTLPFADRELFQENETFHKGKMHVLTSRGCPFECTYCSHPPFNQLYGVSSKKVRRRSVENVILEIRQTCTKARVAFIMFEDDLFASDITWIRRFAEQYSQHVHIPFSCYIRVELVNEEMIGYLKKSGCVTISIGLETANDDLRRRVLNRGMSKQDIIDAARIIKKAGLKLETTNILGIPEGTLQDDIATLHLNWQCHVDYCTVKLLMPYPQTAIREYCLEKGLLAQDHAWSEWHSHIIHTNNKEKLAVENLHKLFAVAVEFPWLWPMIRKMIHYPWGKFYAYIFWLWDGYVSFFRLYPTGLKGFRYGLQKYARILCNVSKGH